MVLRTPLDRLVESALESHLDTLDEGQRELIDRLASETMTLMPRFPMARPISSAIDSRAVPRPAPRY